MLDQVTVRRFKYGWFSKVTVECRIYDRDVAGSTPSRSLLLGWVTLCGNVAQTISVYNQRQSQLGLSFSSYRLFWLGLERGAFISLG